MSFAQPLYLLLLLLLLPYILWYFLFRRRAEASITWASAEPLSRAPHTLRTRLVHLPFMLRCATFVLVVLCLARPQTSTSWRTGETEGIDVMLALDISTSMNSTDISPNRIVAAKEAALKFIANRPNDNIGLTLFGGEAYTQCPLTTGHTMLVRMFKQASTELQAQGIIEPGTAVGMGLASAVAHLEDSKTRSKVVVLLTDGANNTGEISPFMAADMAKKCGIRVYTILLGTNEKTTAAVATLPNGEEYTAPVDDTVDPSTLRQIAQTTGGKFFQAASSKALRQVYDDIDQMEKTKLKINHYSKRYEAFQPFALAALLTLLLEVVLRNTWLRKL